ncbi:RICIN domain-containing protein [Hymenobacter terrenus]|uniref:RICIN domain-containing protein n=1 Tax=Hymenobacter terrenus TaxID=1629124 RepID=UPI0006980804|nr:RICIN domain-containing protein [Hymenobacter terrenus]
MKKISLILAIAYSLASCEQEFSADPRTAEHPTGVVSVGQAVGPTSREVYKWPFSKTSIWNMPIHNNAQYVNANLAYTWLGEDEEPIILTPTAPLTDVYKNGWNTTDRCTNLDGLLTRLPIPAGVVMTAGGTPNQSAAILKADGEHLYQCQPFHRCVAGGPAYAAWSKNHGAWVNDPTRDSEGCISIYGEGIVGGHGASALSSLGGSIRLHELVPGGAIRHALKILVNAPQIAYNNDGSPGYRWPALLADDYAATHYKGSVPALEMGALLALPPAFDPNTLASGPARIIAQALKDYGAYLCDDTARDCLAFSTASEPEGSVREQFERQWGFAFVSNWPVVPGTPTSSAWLADLNTISKNLKVVSNNTAATIGGGPTSDFTNRRAAMAPDFGSANATTAPVPNGVYTLTARHSGKRLDVTGAVATDGTSVQQWSTTNGANQEWQVTLVGAGYYTLTARHSGKLLALDLNAATNGGHSNATTNGVRVFQYGTSVSDNRLWKVEAVPGGYYQLTNKASGKCLDVEGGPGATGEGVKVHSWAYGGGTNQQWKLEPSASLAPAARLPQ